MQTEGAASAITDAPAVQTRCGRQQRSTGGNTQLLKSESIVVGLPFCLEAVVQVPKPKDVMMIEIMKEEYMRNGGEECCISYFRCMRKKVVSLRYMHDFSFHSSCFVLLLIVRLPPY